MNTLREAVGELCTLTYLLALYRFGLGINLSTTRRNRPPAP